MYSRNGCREHSHNGTSESASNGSSNGHGNKKKRVLLAPELPGDLRMYEKDSRMFPAPYKKRAGARAQEGYQWYQCIECGEEFEAFPTDDLEEGITCLCTTHLRAKNESKNPLYRDSLSDLRPTI